MSNRYMSILRTRISTLRWLVQNRMSVLLLLLYVAAAAQAQAQVALYAVSGSTETPVTSVYGFGQVPQGDNKDVVFRAKNASTAPLKITKLAMSGIGFSINENEATLTINDPINPLTVPAGGSFDFTIRFFDTRLTNYSANLQVNSLIVTLLASVVVAPTVSVAAPCTGPDSLGVISFGRIQQATSITCTVTVSNKQTQAITVSPISVTGSVFSASQSSPATIPAGQSISFPVKFAVSAPGAFSGVLTAGARVYTLSGTGFSAPLPTPQFSFDAPTILNGQQRSLSIKLSSPSLVAASGTITLGFTPAASNVADDAAVQFVAGGKRVVPFTVSLGGTNLLLNGQGSVIFSTGTTAGKLTFTMDAGAFGVSGDATTTVTIAPAPVVLSGTGATRTATGLKVTLSGYDNTYSISNLSFAFYDKAGAGICSPISANATANFQSFYKGQTIGSSFLLLVDFPVNGDATRVGSVDVTVTNSAGTVTAQHLAFP